MYLQNIYLHISEGLCSCNCTLFQLTSFVHAYQSTFVSFSSNPHISFKN